MVTQEAGGPTTQTRKVPDRRNTPDRWQTALKRARKQNIIVRQLNDSGAWIATSGTDGEAAYTLHVTGNICTDCSCDAADFGDPVCKHRAAFYAHIGALGLIEEIEGALDDVVSSLEDQEFLRAYCQCGQHKDTHDEEWCAFVRSGGMS